MHYSRSGFSAGNKFAGNALPPHPAFFLIAGVNAGIIFVYLFHCDAINFKKRR